MNGRARAVDRRPPRLLACSSVSRAEQQKRAADRGDDHQHLLRVLRADPGDEHEAGAERADDRADGVRGVDAADQPRRILAARARRAASASGKLAPQRMAAGSTANSARTPSTWKLIHGLVVADGLSGQYGSDCVSVCTPPTPCRRTAAPGTSRARARGRASRDAIADPALLPMPRPNRNDGQNQRKRVRRSRRKSSDSSRVQITSAASAVIPDSAITT